MSFVYVSLAWLRRFESGLCFGLFHLCSARHPACTARRPTPPGEGCGLGSARVIVSPPRALAARPFSLSAHGAGAPHARACRCCCWRRGARMRRRGSGGGCGGGSERSRARRRASSAAPRPRPRGRPRWAPQRPVARRPRRDAWCPLCRHTGRRGCCCSRRPDGAYFPRSACERARGASGRSAGSGSSAARRGAGVVAASKGATARLRSEPRSGEGL